MRKITTLLVLLFFAVSQGAFAQRTITGKVVSSEDELGMPGVPVVVKGTTVGTATDIDGNFTLNVPNGAIIVVSFMGYRTIELPVGNQTQFNVTLQPDAIALGAVVVTALGIQREAKTLTYSAQQVSGAEMMKAQDMNFMNALSGRAAGLEIKQAASGAGGSTKTVLRGAKSFSGDSQPLYVIDGVPMVNRVQGSSGLWQSVDQGDGLSSLNPEDIESISVLKGANAAILYGSQGANGVIMITTKKGQAGTIDVSYNNATTFESITFIPKMQYKYGAINNGDAMESWSVVPHDNPNGYTEKDVKDFFRTGFNMVNNLSISGGTRNTTVYFSYGHTTAKGIIPNNEYLKQNVTFRQSTKLFNDRVTIGSNVMFTDETRYNTMANGFEQNPITGLYWFPRHRDIREFRDEVIDPRTGYPQMLSTTGGTWEKGLAHGWRMFDTDRNLYIMNWFVNDHWQNNPWWLMEMQPREVGGKRVITSANITWDITSNLKFTIKGNYDYAIRKNERRSFAGSNRVQVSPNGTWNFSEYKDRLAYFDAILSYNNSFGDFNLNAIAGISYQETRYGEGVSVNSGGPSTPLKFPNLFTFQNIDDRVMISSTLSSMAIKEGYFANASIGFREMLFLDLSGRVDRSSTLAFADVGVNYFYPGIGLSAIVSQMVSLPSFITFGKVRGSYTTVANDLGFDNIFPRATLTSTGGVTTPTRPNWTEAKPEMITSIEFGTDWRFLEGKVGLDFTYYHITSKDQRMNIPTLQGTGYNTRIVNAGEILNKGVEILVDAEPVSTGNFSWRTSVSFSRNVNKVISVFSDDPDKDIELDLGNSDGYFSYIKAGGSFGDIYAIDFDYDANGRIKFAADGTPLKSARDMYQGSANPDFTLGWNNTFNYKRWSMGFLVNGVFGGVVMSMTESIHDAWGVSKRSGNDRDKTVYNAVWNAQNNRYDYEYVSGGVEVNGVNPDGSERTHADPRLWYTTTGDRNGILATNIYDRTNIRLTQFSLNYSIPVRQLNLPLKSASVGIIGQNLFFLYIKAPYDPERAMSASTSVQALDNFNAPSTRTYGFNIRVNF